MDEIMPNPERTLVEKNQNRRAILQEAYRMRPAQVANNGRASYDDTQSRVNLSDIHYLYKRGYLEVSVTQTNREEWYPLGWQITADGVDLIENDNELEEKLPISATNS